jgi:hypothetical protein
MIDFGPGPFVTGQTYTGTNGLDYVWDGQCFLLSLPNQSAATPVDTDGDGTVDQHVVITADGVETPVNLGAINALSVNGVAVTTTPEGGADLAVLTGATLNGDPVAVIDGVLDIEALEGAVSGNTVELSIPGESPVTLSTDSLTGLVQNPDGSIGTLGVDGSPSTASMGMTSVVDTGNGTSGIVSNWDGTGSCEFLKASAYQPSMTEGVDLSGDGNVDTNIITTSDGDSTSVPRDPVRDVVNSAGTSFKGALGVVTLPDMPTNMVEDVLDSNGVSLKDASNIVTLPAIAADERLIALRVVENPAGTYTWEVDVGPGDGTVSNTYNAGPVVDIDTFAQVALDNTAGTATVTDPQGNSVSVPLNAVASITPDGNGDYTITNADGTSSTLSTLTTLSSTDSSVTVTPTVTGFDLSVPPGAGATTVVSTDSSVTVATTATGVDLSVPPGAGATTVVSTDNTVAVAATATGVDLSVPAPPVVESTDSSVTVATTASGFDLSVPPGAGATTVVSTDSSVTVAATATGVDLSVPPGAGATTVVSTDNSVTVATTATGVDLSVPPGAGATTVVSTDNTVAVAATATGVDISAPQVTLTDCDGATIPTSATISPRLHGEHGGLIQLPTIPSPASCIPPDAPCVSEGFIVYDEHGGAWEKAPGAAVDAWVRTKKATVVSIVEAATSPGPLGTSYDHAGQGGASLVKIVSVDVDFPNPTCDEMTYIVDFTARLNFFLQGTPPVTQAGVSLVMGGSYVWFYYVQVNATGEHSLDNSHIGPLTVVVPPKSTETREMYFETWNSQGLDIPLFHENLFGFATGRGTCNNI